MVLKSVERQVTNPTTMEYSTKYLAMFTGATVLSQYVCVSLSSNYPIHIEYSRGS